MQCSAIHWLNIYIYIEPRLRVADAGEAAYAANGNYKGTNERRFGFSTSSLLSNVIIDL